MKEPDSILIFRNASIGNTLVALPAIRALRRRYPQAYISVVVDRIGDELLRFCSDIDERIVYEKRGADKSLIANLRLIRRLRKLKPDCAVLFKRFFRNGLLSFLAGAPVRIGFRTEGKAPFLNLTADYHEPISMIDLNLRLAALLDAPAVGRGYTIELAAEDHRDAEARLSTLVPEGRSFVVVHYGGNTWSPCVPIDRLCEIVHTLARNDEKVLLIGAGSREEAHARKILTQLPSATTAFGLPLRTLAAILGRARFFLGFNSGPTHIAAGTTVRGVVFFERTPNVEWEVNRWRPASENLRCMVPPVDSSDAAWNPFLHEFQQILKSSAPAEAP